MQKYKPTIRCRKLISINDCGGQIKQSGFYTFKQKLESEGLWPEIKWRLS